MCLLSKCVSDIRDFLRTIEKAFFFKLLNQADK